MKIELHGVAGFDSQTRNSVIMNLKFTKTKQRLILIIHIWEGMSICDLIKFTDSFCKITAAWIFVYSLDITKTCNVIEMYMHYQAGKLVLFI